MTGVWLDIYPIEKGEKGEFRFSDETHNLLLESEDVFPLKKISFENSEFYVVNNYEKLLQQEYGDFMSFPKTDVLHHDLGRGPLAEWHCKYDVSMEDVIDELRNLYECENKNAKIENAILAGENKK